MKKNIFINICVITSLCLFRIPNIVESIEFIKIIPILAYVIAILHVKHIFISRENRVGKKRKVYLYLLIVLCYMIIVASTWASYFEDIIIKFCLDNTFITVYLILIVIYFNAIFKGENREIDKF